MAEIKLEGKRLENAFSAARDYASKVDNNPLTFAFSEGVQWADNNQGWHTTMGNLTKMKESLPILVTTSTLSFGCIVNVCASEDDLVEAQRQFEYFLPLSVPKF